MPSEQSFVTNEMLMQNLQQVVAAKQALMQLQLSQQPSAPAVSGGAGLPVAGPPAGASTFGQGRGPQASASMLSAVMSNPSQPSHSVSQLAGGQSVSQEECSQDLNVLQQKSTLHERYPYYSSMGLDRGDDEGHQGACDQNWQVDLQAPTPVGGPHSPNGVLVYSSVPATGDGSPAAMVYLKPGLNKDLVLSEPPNGSTAMRTSTDQHMLGPQQQAAS